MIKSKVKTVFILIREGLKYYHKFMTKQSPKNTRIKYKGGGYDLNAEKRAQLAKL